MTCIIPLPLSSPPCPDVSTAPRACEIEFAFPLVRDGRNSQCEPTAMHWRVMPYEPFDEAPCFGGGKRVVKLAYGAERSAPDAHSAQRVVLHEKDCPGGAIADNVGI